MQGMHRSSCTGAVLFFIFVGWALPGCLSMPAPEGTPVVHNAQFEDIPVPRGFDFVENDSWAFLDFQKSPLPFRSAKLVYTGRRPISELATWYEQQMPMQGWKHEGTMDRNGVQITFSKNYEQAEVVLSRAVDPDTRKFITQVTCQIGAR